MARESKRRREGRRFGRPERLADLCLGTPPEQWTYNRGFPEIPTLIRSIQSDIARAVILDAENVKDYFFEHPQGEWDYSEDFPCIAPPFPLFLVEFGKPRRTVIGDRILPVDPKCPPRLGFLFWAIDARGRKLPLPDCIGLPADIAMSEVAGARWFVSALPLIPDGDNPAYISAVKYFAVDEKGCMIGPPILAVPNSVLPAHLLNELDVELTQFFMPALLAISFSNCKNVALSPVEPDAALNRERKKHGLRPFLRYHTIDIEPMKRVLRTEGQSESVGLKRALHICRGHFSTYTEEKPLFGKVAGTFWVPSHVRGSAREGVVVSDYRVGAPKASAS